MKRVILESPYAGELRRNISYARRAVVDCLRRGESPIASHLLYTQPGVLDDRVPADRELGITAGLAWLKCAEAMVVYVDHGISSGMKAAIEDAEAAGVPVERRTLEREKSRPEGRPSSRQAKPPPREGDEEDHPWEHEHEGRFRNPR